MVQDDIEDHRVRPGVGRGSLISRTEARGGATAIEVQDVGVMAGTGVVVEENILGGRGEILQGDLTVELSHSLYTLLVRRPTTCLLKEQGRLKKKCGASQLRFVNQSCSARE